MDTRFWVSQAFNSISYGALLFLVNSMTSRGKVLAVAGLVIALGVITPHTNSFLILLITRALVLGILAMSLDLLLGFTGLASLGQAAYLGIGAYLTAILATKIPIWAWMELLAGDRLRDCDRRSNGGAVWSLRNAGERRLFRDDHAGLGQCVWGLAYRWNSLTGGDNGINLPRRPAFCIQLSDDVTYFYVVFGFFVLSLLLLYILVESPFGRSLVGIREREVRMRILGYNTCLHKYLLCHCRRIWRTGRSVMGARQRSGEPGRRGLDHLGRCAVDGGSGGAGTLVGGAIGAGIVVFMREHLSTLVPWWQYALGGLYVLTIL